MKLQDALFFLKPSDLTDCTLPAALLGVFRRKSISFYNGLTDENTIVYWLQSKTFTLDLRLKDARETPIVERQAWIGQTLWDTDKALLSWDVQPYANFQNHIQWPEPAKLHAIGNALLEFSPSNAYVEDWRQQAVEGLYLGLRLKSAHCIETQAAIEMDAAYIICGSHMAYAQTRMPSVQAQIQHHAHLQQAIDVGISESDLCSFEFSLCTHNDQIQYSTQDAQVGQTLNLDDFEVMDESHLKQRRTIQGQHVELIFEVDVYCPHYVFQHTTDTTSESQTWLAQEQHHLMHHAHVVYG